MALVAKLVELDDIGSSIGSQDLHLFDVRWYLDGRSGYDAFLEGHIKSAKYLDVDTCLCDSDNSDPTLGRHPLPDPKSFESVLSSFGASRDHHLVFYDDQAGSIAARAWWMASAIGFDAALLNGGLMAAPKEMIETGASPVKSLPRLPYASHATTWDPNLIITEAELKAKVKDSSIILLDARSKERYLGLNETVDPKSGHIPGAVNAFWRQNIDRKHRFKHPNEIAKNFSQLGIEPTTEKQIVSSCGSGITACHNIFSLLYALQIQARLFPPSFSGWCRSNDNEIET
ncbi:MAG: sulfurtransferase [Acidimicrobiaceae bacterium]|nr:sulfurtransferase [Acidimicrobiaceae bacterium]